jgi:ABC transport system ATP-binding/permease protein
LRVSVDGRSMELPPGEHSIGRAEDCRIIVEDMRVSRQHAVLRSSADGWSLEDLGSTCGTFLDGQRAERLAISGPVEVLLGDADDGTRLRLEPLVERREAPPTGEIAPPPTPSPSPSPSPTPTPTTAEGARRPRPTGVFASMHAAGERTVLGRDASCDVVIEDLLVSRRHAELRRLPDGRYELEDLGSRNGTFVNGRRVQRQVLDELDLVTIGLSSFLFALGRLEEYRDTGSVTFEASGITVVGDHGTTLLEDVSFSLTERSLLGIVGPSGSGKSTLLAALSGLRPATSGTVLYGGRDLYADYDELRNRIGFVPQEDILHRELPLRQALEYAARLRFPAEVTEGERTARIDEVLDELGLGHRADAPISRLSGGQRKRTSVALELLTKPSLLFLDEPASGLDPGLARVLMRLLRDLADGGRTIVVVTHELDNLRLCDQILVLAPGGVPAYCGPPQQAAARFEREDLVDVFSDLATEPAETWRQQPPAVRPVGREVHPPPDPVRQQGWWSQTRTLAARYLSVLAADRRNLALLLAQAPVLGVLMLAALPAGELGVPPPPEVRLVSTAGLVLFVLLLGATWVGANNAIREIARELPVLRRERGVGLSLSAYVTSKVIVLAGLTTVQAVVLVAVATARQRGPRGAVLLGWPLGELMVVVALAGVAAMALALLVSALAGTPERATSILPMLLILQLVLSAGAVLPEIADRPVLRELGALSSAQWGVAAAASTADLNDLQLFDERLRGLRTVDVESPADAVASLTAEGGAEARWEHSPGAWGRSVGALLVLTMASVGATILVLRRYDPGR